MTTFLTNDTFAILKGYDYFVGYTITTVAKSALTDGDYFIYTNGAGTGYYVWFDQVGDLTNDPLVPGRTAVPVDISAISTAIDIATALATALDALTASSASSVGTVVTLTNADNAVKSAVVDQNTTMVIAQLGYAAENEFPPVNTLTKYRERAYANITTEARGLPTLDADYLEDLEYRMVELMIDEEQGRSTEEGRPQYIPRDYMYERDRSKVSSAGVTGFTRGTSH